VLLNKNARHDRNNFRRFVWNFFRLENEHLNNCGQFRAVRDISIAPMNSNDQALLEQMMDEEDGVTNRPSAIDRRYRLRAASTKLDNSICGTFYVSSLRLNIIPKGHEFATNWCKVIMHWILCFCLACEIYGNYLWQNLGVILCNKYVFWSILSVLMQGAIDKYGALGYGGH